jgi:2-methylcitrate dehydratase PrpD
MPTFAESLAAFAADLSPATLPAEVADQAGRLLLDTVGVTLAAVPEDFAASVHTVARGLGGPPEATLWGGDARVGAAAAVLANGTLAHGLDYDDTLEEAIVHTGCCCATAALAVGEARHAPGAAVLAAVAAGVEVMAAVGQACPGAFHRRGFHPTALCGSFGAAAAAGRLLGLRPAALATAFGLCGSQASGIIEYLADGSWSKRLHAGWAAHAGLIAVSLAQAGFTGPRTVFEGTHGFYRAFGGEAPEPGRLAQLAKGLGHDWALLRLMFKAYPCGSINQPYMDCAARIRATPGFDPRAVREVVCRTAEGPVHRLWEPLADKRRPATPYGAKFSLPYCIALVLAEGAAGVEGFSEARIRDPRLLDLAAKVGYVVDATLPYPRRFTGHVRVTLADGRVLEETQDAPRGGPEMPLSRAALRAKFQANAARALPPDRVEDVRGRLEAIARAPDVATVAAALARAGGPPPEPDGDSKHTRR